jgi:hypothetical protein
MEKGTVDSRFTFSGKAWYTEYNSKSSVKIGLLPDQVREHPNRFTLLS